MSSRVSLLKVANEILMRWRIYGSVYRRYDDTIRLEMGRHRTMRPLRHVHLLRSGIDVNKLRNIIAKYFNYINVSIISRPTILV